MSNNCQANTHQKHPLSRGMATDTPSCDLSGSGNSPIDYCYQCSTLNNSNALMTANHNRVVPGGGIESQCSSIESNCQGLSQSNYVGRSESFAKGNRSRNARNRAVTIQTTCNTRVTLREAWTEFAINVIITQMLKTQMLVIMDPITLYFPIELKIQWMQLISISLSRMAESTIRFCDPIRRGKMHHQFLSDATRRLQEASHSLTTIKMMPRYPGWPP